MKSVGPILGLKRAVPGLRRRHETQGGRGKGDCTHQMREGPSSGLRELGGTKSGGMRCKC